MWEGSEKDCREFTGRDLGRGINGVLGGTPRKTQKENAIPSHCFGWLLLRDIFHVYKQVFFTTVL